MTNPPERMLLVKVRLLLWEWVAIAVGVARGLIETIKDVYQYRKLIAKALAQAWRVRVPLLIASIIVFTQWVRSGVGPETFWNFPPGSRSPFPHLSLYAAPLLDNLTYPWIASLALSIAYLSLKRAKRFSWVEKLSSRMMKVTLLFYPGVLLWFSVYAEASFLIPSWAKLPLYLLAAYPLSLIVFRSIETVVDRRIFGKKGLLTVALDNAFAVGRVGMQSIGLSSYNS